MITKQSSKYGYATADHFWIVCRSEKECMEELRQYAKEHPEQDICYINCGTRPGKPIPVTEATFEVYTPQSPLIMPFGWSLYKYGKPWLKEG
jgi:hypothetical protein